MLEELEELEEYNYTKNVKINDTIYKLCKEIRNVREYIYELGIYNKEVKKTRILPFIKLKGSSYSFEYKNIFFFDNNDRIIVGSIKNKKQIIFFDCKYDKYTVVSNLLSSHQINKLFDIVQDIKMKLLDTKKEEINEFFK